VALSTSHPVLNLGICCKKATEFLILQTFVRIIAALYGFATVHEECFTPFLAVGNIRQRALNDELGTISLDGEKVVVTYFLLCRTNVFLEGCEGWITRFLIAVVA
jgi:hypothetical protein